jgi:hypothetical protein
MSTTLRNRAHSAVRDLPTKDAEDLLRGRVQVIDLWRPIHGPLPDAPLAVCDARTIEQPHLLYDIVNRGHWTIRRM